MFQVYHWCGKSTVSLDSHCYDLGGESLVDPMEPPFFNFIHSMLFSLQDSRISVPSCGTPNWREWLQELGQTLEDVTPCVFVGLLSDSRVVLLQLRVVYRLTTSQGVLLLNDEVGGRWCALC